MTHRRKISSAAVVAIMLLGYQRRASAYIDPGTGSMMVQALIATVAGVALIVRTYWGKLREIARSIFHRETSDRRD